MKKAFSLLLAAALTLSLAACGGSGSAANSEPASAPAASEPAEGGSGADAGDTYTIGIMQQVQHPALDQATQGFKDAVTAALGDAVTFAEQNGNDDVGTLNTIANSFVSDGVDLIMANATKALQAASAATSDIPILGTSITEYGVALGVDDFASAGLNVSGTSDLAPLDEQAQMLADLFPVADHPNVGLLYCSGEPNSQFQVDNVSAALTGMGYSCEMYSFTDTNDLAGICQDAATTSDVIYIPTDNAAASNTELINSICLPAGVPIIAGEEGICSGCGVATLSISYYDIGYATGEMAVKILTEGADVTTMPVQYAPQFVKEYNAANAEALNVTIPEDYVAIEG